MSLMLAQVCKPGSCIPPHGHASTFQLGGMKGGKMEFKDQYKHPNWQKKRLEALEKAEFTCQRCYDAGSQLHVHHKRYVKGRKIWEYELTDLSVLCESCHEIAHEEKDDLQEILSRLHPEGIGDVLSLIAGYCHIGYGPTHVDLTEDPILERVNGYVFILGKIAGYLAGNSRKDIEKILSAFEPENLE